MGKSIFLVEKFFTDIYFIVQHIVSKDQWSLKITWALEKNVTPLNFLCVFGLLLKLDLPIWIGLYFLKKLNN